MTADIVERWTLCGYAPGDYICKCWTCGAGFTGDKRAIQCLPCAGKHAAARIEALEKALREIAETNLDWTSGKGHEDAIFTARTALGEPT